MIYKNSKIINKKQSENDENTVYISSDGVEMKSSSNDILMDI